MILIASARAKKCRARMCGFFLDCQRNCHLQTNVVVQWCSLSAPSWPAFLPGRPHLNSIVAFICGLVDVTRRLQIIWLVVSTPLKNISQWEGLFPIYWKIKNVPNHQPVFVRKWLPILTYPANACDIFRKRRTEFSQLPTAGVYGEVANIDLNLGKLKYFTNLN